MNGPYPRPHATTVRRGTGCSQGNGRLADLCFCRTGIDDLGDAGYPVLEDPLETRLEGHRRSRAGNARSDEFHGHEAGFFVDVVKHDIAVVGLNRRADDFDDLFNLSAHPRILGTGITSSTVRHPTVGFPDRACETFAMSAPITSVQFFADACCPWTWNTSRWLVDVSTRHGVDVEWRTLSLAELNKDRDVPEHFRPRLACSRRLARVLESLRADGRNDMVAAIFADYGARLHHDEASPDDSLLIASVTAVGLDLAETMNAADDARWDSAITTSVTEALELAGPDVGSPIIASPLHGRGFFGPIVSPPPVGPDADALWQILSGALHLPDFFELKRGRNNGVEFGPRP